jgi:hypothetical protein
MPKTSNAIAHLPLVAEEFLPSEKDTAAGAVDDARPRVRAQPAGS